jgi:glutamine synthetase
MPKGHDKSEASAGFIARHGLWTGDQVRLARDIAARARAEGLHLIRLAWSDSHGQARAKAVTLPVFEAALVDGYNVNVATWTLDAAGGRVFASFTPGSGMDLPEMTGSPNLVVVPDPETFRVLPWAPGVGWVLCDEYFRDGAPFHFSARHRLRQALDQLAARGLTAVIGLEVEWTLLRLLEDTLAEENIGVGGQRGRPLRATPLDSGFSYHSETNMDLMQPILSALTGQFEDLGLGLRSMENEWGAGQVECTFDAKDALRAADDVVLFRAATRQICRRMGHMASFMAVPAGKGLYPSGWHLHLSLTDAKTGENRLTPDAGPALLSPMGQSFLAGLLENAQAGAVFATPTVNGYRRFRANSLAPDRAGWGFDHRGTMVRLLGGPGDAATRYENRIGEPAANPYLFIAAQIAAGLDGVDRKATPWPADDTPYEADRPMLPVSLPDALAALEKSPLYRDALGAIYIRYYLALKRAELSRFDAFLSESGADPAAGVTDWEMNEYFDAF